MLALNGENLPVPIMDYTLVPHNVYSLFFLIEIQLIYNVLTSAIQQCNLVIHFTYIHTHSSLFFPLAVYHRILNRVPCGIQGDLVVHLSMIVCIC